MKRSEKSPLVGWIPAAALGVAVVAVLVTTGVLLSNGLGGPVPEPTEGQVTDLNWSSFTEDGLAYIAATRQVRIDMSNPPVDAAALGLAADDTLVLEPILNLDTQLDYDLIVNGAGEGPGGARFIVTEISIVTKKGVVTQISAPLREVVNFRQTLNYLVAQAVVFGWDTSGVDSIFQTAEDATRAGEGYEFTFGPGDRTGVNFSATASCDPSGFCLVRYDVTPRVR
ncbi:MAG: hypothetical protein Q8M65_11020 [Rhodoglobus sp.]|nr:hypothetical protein [Rhodoglobus sp.]